MGNVIMEATQINYRRDDTLKTVDQKLQELSQESAIDTDIAPVFKSTETYNPGDLVYYRNKLYKCLNTHTGAWAAGDFASTDVSTAINAAVGALDAIKADASNIAPAFDATASYEIGDLVYYGGTIYRCINDHTGDWYAEDFSATAIDVELSELNSKFTNLVNRGVTDNAVAVDSTDTITLPSGTDSNKVRVLSCFLSMGGVYYYDSAEILYLNNGVFTVKNTGGSAGYIAIDYIIQ